MIEIFKTTKCWGSVYFFVFSEDRQTQIGITPTIGTIAPRFGDVAQNFYVNCISGILDFYPYEIPVFRTNALDLLFGTDWTMTQVRREIKRCQCHSKLWATSKKRSP